MKGTPKPRTEKIRGEDLREGLEAVPAEERQAWLQTRNLRGATLSGTRLGEFDFSGLDLEQADLSGASLEKAMFASTQLSGAAFREAVLDDAELCGAKLVGADLRSAKAPRVGLGGVDLREALLFEADLEGAVMSHARLDGADLRCARLDSARVHNASLRDADLSKASLRDAEFDGTDLRGAIFDGADLRGARFPNAHDYEKASWVGVDIRECDFRGAHLLRRHIIDENYLHEFRNASRTHEWIYRAWSLSSDCGRSFARWFGLTLAVALVFSLTYRFVDLDLGDHPTPLSLFYFSIVTLTTLGYGDVLPASLPAQIMVIAEVLVGYLMLGGLISILANKIARRGE